MKRNLYPLLLFGFVLLFCCKKTDTSNTPTNANLHDARQAFNDNNYGALMYQSVNDTLAIYWNPQWSQETEIVQADTVTFMYVPLKGELVKKADKQPATRQLNVDGVEEYLIITKTKKELHFKRATYYTAPQLPNAKAKTGIQEKPTPYIRELVPTLGEKNNTSKARTTTVTCRTYFVCDFYSGCGGLYTYTSTKSETSCSCPTKRFDNCGDNSPPCGQWYQLNSDVVEECTPDDPPPPPPVNNNYPYARIELDNVEQNQTDDYDNNVHRTWTTANAYIRFYKDKACTISAEIPAGTVIYYYICGMYYNTYGSTNSCNPYSVTPSSNTHSIFLAFFTSRDDYSEPNFSEHGESDYEVDKGTGYNVTW